VAKIEQLERNRSMPYITSIERIGIEKGFQEAWREGWRQGWREGWREGRQEGEAIILELQLERRFGPLEAAIRARLKSAAPQQLERWAENILDAATLEEVFR
jgi:flagellar biosynthesis/type III secretory pathway protein FliH